MALARMWLQLARNVVPSVVVAFCGTADLQRKYRVVFSVLVVQLAVFEPQIPAECPACTAPLDLDDQDISIKEEQIGSMQPSGRQLLRIAILLHCVAMCGKIARVTFLVLIWFWRNLCQTLFSQAGVVEANSHTHLTLRAKWPTELARERMG